MRKRIAGIIALCLGVLIAVKADAQTWRSFTTADGLASNNVPVMFEDRNGNLWFGTSGGLSQFKGFFLTHLSGMLIYCSPSFHLRSESLRPSILPATKSVNTFLKHADFP